MFVDRARARLALVETRYRALTTIDNLPHHTHIVVQHEHTVMVEEEEQGVEGKKQHRKRLPPPHTPVIGR